MRFSRRAAIAAVSVGIVAVAGWLLFQRYWYYLPGIMARIRNPIEANHAVVWAQGPKTAALPAGERPPNIILILADDLGFNDLTVNGGGVAGGLVPTPNIDSIAHNGVMFSQGYAGNATCAPSRAALMTGRYATRFGFEFTPTPPSLERFAAQYDPAQLHQAIYRADLESQVPSMAAQAVPTSEITLAELLKKRGYHTLWLGKWHLGETDKTRPEARGFNDALGFYPGASAYLPANDPNAVNSYQPFDPIDKFFWANIPFAVTFNGSHRFAPSEYMTDYLGGEAAKAIAANRNRPFFMYWAANAPHIPLQALKSDYDALPQIKDHRLRVYAAMIGALDRNVGRILAALKDNGLDKNTLIIFTSDNGGASYIGLPQINRPFRGWKMTFFEGGIHVPYFMQWPARIAPGSVYSMPVGHIDVFATAAAAAGAPLPKDRVMDGVDLIPYVTGQMAQRPHQTLYWRSGDYKTLLDGDWKLQYSGALMKVWLFDLKSDPTEKNNLAASNPGKLKTLLATLAELDRQQRKPLWPQLVDAPIDIDHPLSFPQNARDEYVYWGN